jgi:hypothetical protein
MLYAKQNGAITLASPGARAACPSCGKPVVAKCGHIVVWHWAHQSKDCDPWAEPMSEWHARWQQLAPADRQEVVMEKNGERHRADVIARNGGVLELQYSSIGVADIRRRERFYGHMAWMYHAHWTDRLHFGKYGFWWKHGAITQTAITKPLFWDLGDEVWRVSLSRAKERVYGVLDRATGQIRSHVDIQTSRVLGKVVRRWKTDEFARATFGRSFSEVA